MGRPRKKPIEQTQPTAEPTAEAININSKPITTMAEEQKNDKVITETDMTIRELRSQVSRLQTDNENLKSQIEKNKEILKNSVTNTKSIGDKKITELNQSIDNLNATIKTKDARIAELEKVFADFDEDYYLKLEDENESLKQQLAEAEKHNTEISQNITGKLQIPMDDFARKCYVTWCETYSKDPRWSDNYKQNAAQFEKWGLAPNSLNMPILMVLANMLGKVDSISFDCKIPKEVVVKIAEDCKNSEK